MTTVAARHRRCPTSPARPSGRMSPTDRATSFAALRRYAPRVAPGSARGDPHPWSPVLGRHPPRRRPARQPPPTIFCSSEGVGTGRIPVEFLELNSSFLVMDAPRHTKLRRHRQRGLHAPPGRPARRADLGRGGALVDEYVDAGGGDVVEGLSKHLPLWTISTMVGVPEELRADLVPAAEGMITIQDPEFVSTGRGRAELAHRVRGRAAPASPRDRSPSAPAPSPTDDLMSALVHAEVDGERLADQELGAFVVLLRGGRQRHHPQLDQPRHASSSPTTRSSGSMLRADPSLMAHRRSRRSCAAPRRSSTSAARATTDTELAGVADRRGRSGRHVLRVGQPRRGRVRRPGPLRHRPRPQPPRRLRRWRTALLPGRQPGPGRAASRVHPAGRAGRGLHRRRTRPPHQQLRQRHQADVGRGHPRLIARTP